MNLSQGFNFFGKNASKVNPISTGLTTEVPFSWKVRGMGTRLDLTEKTPVEQDLVRDLFWQSVMNTPMLKEDEQIPDGRLVNKRLIEYLTNGQGWEETRNLTVNRTAISASTAQLTAENLLHDPDVQEALRKQAEAEELAKQAQKLQDEVGYAPDQQQADEMQKRANQKMQQAQQKQKEALDKVDDKMSGMGGRAFKQSIQKQAQQEAEESAEALGTWGSEGGEDEQADLEKIKKLLKQMDESGRMGDLTALIGRVKAIAKAISGNRVSSAVTTLTDVNVTKKFSRMLASERSKLAASAPMAMRANAARRYLNEGLLGTVDRTEALRSGRMVIAKDGSGSMSSGMRHPLASALSIGMAKAALEENDQTFELFVFGSRAEISEAVNNQTGVKGLMEFAGHLFGGGTDFDAAINHALDLAEVGDPEKTDIVMITDGDCGIGGDTKERMDSFREKHGMRLMVILVEPTHPELPENLTEAADHVIVINDARKIEQAAEALAKAVFER